MEVKTITKYIKISPKKVRLVVDVIRGMDIMYAVDYLKFVPKKASGEILKLFQSTSIMDQKKMVERAI